MRRLSPVVLCAVCSLFGCKKKQEEPVAPAAAAPAVDVLEPVSEVEPNDDSKSPQVLARPSEVSGALTPAGAKPDDDWYKIDLSGGTKVVSAELSAVPGTDTAIEVYDADKNRLFRVNSAGENAVERLANVTFSGAGFLKVTHGKKEGAGGAYSMRVRFAEPRPNEEIEPNDRWVMATPLVPGTPVRGFVGHDGDEDWYAIDLKSAPPGAVLRAELSGVPEVRGELGVAGSSNQAIFHTVRAADLGERLNIRNLGVSPDEEKYFLVVKGGHKGKQRTFNPTVPYTLTATWEDGGSDMEFEPNDEVARASEVALDGKLKTGYLSPKSDVDWFVIRQKSEQGAFVRLELMVPDRTDMMMSIYRPPSKSDGRKSGVKPDDEASLIMKVNDGGLLEPEVVPTLWIPPGETFLKVEGAYKNLDGKWVRDYENTREPYRLVYTVRSAEDESQEREPNDKPESATPISMGDALTGYLAPKKDVDYYKLDMGDEAGPVLVTVSGILKADVSVYLLGADGKEVLTSSDKGKGETEERFEYNVGPGVVYVMVKDASGHGFNTTDPYTLTVKKP